MSQLQYGIWQMPLSKATYSTLNVYLLIYFMHSNIILCALPGNQTYNLVVASTMLYCLSYSNAVLVCGEIHFKHIQK